MPRSVTPVDRARLVVRAHPFRPEAREIVDVSPGVRTVAALLDGHALERHGEVKAEWIVHVNGRRLAESEFDVFAPGAGDLVVARRVPRPPVIAFIIAYAVAFVLSAVGVSAATAVAVATAVGTVAGYVAGFAIPAALSVGLQKAFAPDLPKAIRVGSSTPFYSVQGGRNQMNPHGLIQQSYGGLRTVPDLLRPMQTVISSDAKQSLRALYNVGQGHYTVTDIRHGTQPIDLLNPTRLVVWNGLNDDPIEDVLAGFLDNIFEEQLNINLEDRFPEGTAEFVRSTQDDALAFETAIVYPSGLWRATEGSSTADAAHRLTIKYRLNGTSDPWIIAFDEEVRAHLKNKFARNLHVDLPAPGRYDVSVKITPSQGRPTYAKERGGTGGTVVRIDQATWSTLRSFLAGSAFNLDAARQLTIVGIEAQASEVLQGQMDTVTVHAQRLLPTYSSSPEGWSDVLLGADNPAAYTATSNPAWAFANELRDAGLPDDELDADEVLRWAEFCEDEGWTHNSTQTEQVTLEDSLRTIASCGQASPTMRESRFSVLFDELKSPVAAFGPHNMKDLKITYTAGEEVHALRVRYPEQTIDGKLKQITVYFDGHTRDTATEYRTLDVMNGLTDETHVRRYVTLEREKQRLRRALYAFEAPLEANICELGDVALLSYGGAWLGDRDAQARVLSYTTKNAGAHIDEVILDTAVRVEVGRTYVLKVRARAANGHGYTVHVLPIVNPLTAGVQKLTALEVDGNVAVPTYIDDEEQTQTDTLENAIAFLGPPEAAEVVVLSVEPLEHGTCRITAIDYAPEIFD